MLDTITLHLLDILSDDERLIAGGNAWSVGFSGVRRVSDGEAAAADYINVFESPFANDAEDARPALYIGSAANEATDELDFPTISSVRIEHRTILIPLFVVVRGSSRVEARKKRNQLRGNILYILLDHLVEEDYWYEMRIPGQAGGGDARQQQFSSSTGGNGLGVNEAGCVIPVTIKYSFVQGGERV